MLTQSGMVLPGALSKYADERPVHAFAKGLLAVRFEPLNARSDVTHPRLLEAARFIKSRINNLVLQMKKFSQSAPLESRLHLELKEAHRNVNHTGWLLGDIVQLPHSAPLEDSVPKFRKWLRNIVERCLTVDDATGRAYAKTVIAPMMELHAEFERLTETAEYKDLVKGLKSI